LRYADLSDEQRQLVERLLLTEEEVPEEDAETAREVVDRLLGRLKPKDRLIITLLHLENRSVAEIRELTGWGTAAIKVRAFRARQKLKRFFAQTIQPFK
jgi:RNA polymerase sigma-70 factor (ECF subfamily)